jgi:hypothetical protein
MFELTYFQALETLGRLQGMLSALLCALGAILILPLDMQIPRMS